VLSPAEQVPCYLTRKVVTVDTFHTMVTRYNSLHTLLITGVDLGTKEDAQSSIFEGQKAFIFNCYSVRMLKDWRYMNSYVSTKA